MDFIGLVRRTLGWLFRAFEVVMPAMILTVAALSLWRITAGFSLWVALLFLIGLWLWHTDRDDRNPYVVVRTYRVAVLLLMALVLMLGYKSYVWNRDLRQLLLDVQRNLEAVCTGQDG